jgi:TPR repeat protein
MKINRIIQTAVIAIFAASIGCKEPQQKKANTNEVAADQKPVDIKSAAEGGDADAQYMLAMAYGKGDEMPKDYIKKFQWLEKASTQNHPAALYELGTFYFSGIGAIQDEKYALSLFRKAAELGNRDAQYTAGSLMALGRFGEENTTEGVRLLRLAAEAGQTEAFSILGSVLNFSTKDYYNPVEAAKWLLISQLLGGDESKSLSEIENEIGEEKFAEGRRLANEWYKMNILEKK